MEKKVKKATALSYTPNEDKAPKIIASGKGVLAEKILEKAKEEEIPVVEDSNLVEELVKLSIGSEIPVELYEVVAEVLSFVSRVDEKAAKKFKHDE
ncbi:MAG: flagellar biogenesis protein [Clostridiaceae bacterium]|jgi:flagellar biosynthesis protein|nr:flagellar biogenesis protein [Clostridiaceae bacterium]